eukprot:TRINITY_DN1858_c0_g1_i1.p1 TRINITY_DN1858_c0_g1~~TRINITY_DN1858_c0_g1_i1.p1  ORF type:complete len:171 (+),score=38.45 TRINITY_DN1858_c0_g1_i1:62-574(+)
MEHCRWDLEAQSCLELTTCLRAIDASKLCAAPGYTQKKKPGEIACTLGGGGVGSCAIECCSNVCAKIKKKKLCKKNKNCGFSKGICFVVGAPSPRPTSPANENAETTDPCDTRKAHKSKKLCKAISKGCTYDRKAKKCSRGRCSEQKRKKLCKKLKACSWKNDKCLSKSG